MPQYVEGLGDSTDRRITHRHGYLEYRYAPAYGCEMVHLQIEEDHRRKGIGSLLLKQLETDPLIKYLYGFMESTNAPIKAWYLHHGFTLVPIPDYYTSGRHAVLGHKLLR